MSLSVEELAVDDKSPVHFPDSPFPDQVYKVVVQWSNGTSTIIYRRYSMFFDFMVSQAKMKYFGYLGLLFSRDVAKMGAGITVMHNCHGVSGGTEY